MHIFTNKQEKGVVSLAAVFTVGVISLGAALAVTTGALATINKNRNINYGNKSMYAAESAAREGLYQQFGRGQDASFDESFVPINESSTVRFTNTGSEWPIIAIKGTAKNNLASRNIVYTLNIFPEGFVFENAIYSQNDITLGGSTEINGNIFANKQIKFNGTKVTVNGDAYSPEGVSDEDSVQGEVFTDVEYLPPPSIDTTEYKEMAKNNSTYFTDKSSAYDYLNNKNNKAVVFVEGSNLKLDGSNTELTGSLVVDGDLELNGGTFNKFGNYLTIIVKGDLKISGNTTVNGIIYTEGEASFGGGNNKINGALISAGETAKVNLSGDTQITWDPKIKDTWKDVVGLDKESSFSKPKFMYWKEY